MADLKTRMQRVAAPKPDDAPTPPPPFQTAPPVFKHRVSLDLTSEDYRALKRGAFDQDVPMVELLRSLVTQWREDEGLQALVTVQLSKHVNK